MTKTLTILSVLSAFGIIFLAGMALADEDCFVPMADWQPKAAVAEFAKQKGWNVRQIKVDDGCYEIEGFDVDGNEIEVRLHPATLDVLEFDQETIKRGLKHDK